MACKNGSAGMIEALLKGGADANFADELWDHSADDRGGVGQ